MQQQPTIEATAFGRVLAGLLASRGIPAEPEKVAEIAERSGLEGEGFLTRVTVGMEGYGEDLTGLAEELQLSTREKRLLAFAYVYEEEYGGS